MCDIVIHTIWTAPRQFKNEIEGRHHFVEHTVVMIIRLSCYYESLSLLRGKTDNSCWLRTDQLLADGKLNHRQAFMTQYRLRLDSPM